MSVLRPYLKPYLQPYTQQFGTTNPNPAIEPAYDPAFEALTYNPLTFEVYGVELGVGHVTAVHDVILYAPDYLGGAQAFAPNVPVWELGRVSGGSVYVDDGFGNLLSPAPVLSEVAYSDIGMTVPVAIVNVFNSDNHSNVEGPYLLNIETDATPSPILTFGTSVALSIEFVTDTQLPLITNLYGSSTSAAPPAASGLPELRLPLLTDLYDYVTATEVKSDKVVKLTDGVNTVSLPLDGRLPEVGRHAVGMLFDDSTKTMALYLDGMYSVEVPYTGFFGSGLITLGINANSLKRGALASIASQKSFISRELT